MTRAYPHNERLGARLVDRRRAAERARRVRENWRFVGMVALAVLGAWVLTAAVVYAVFRLGAALGWWGTW